MLPQPLRFVTGQRPDALEPLAGAKPFVAALSAALSHEVVVDVAPDYAAIANMVIHGLSHLAWMPPVAHARATLAGAHLIAVAQRQGALAYRAAILVRAGSAWTAPSGLRGVRAAWTDPSSASGWLFPRLHLLAAGVDPRRDVVSEHFYGTAARALEAVATGAADVCACFTREHAISTPAIALDDAETVWRGARDALRVLAITDPIPPDGLVAGPSLDEADRARIAQALFTLHDQKDGRTALDELMQAERLVAPTDDVLRLIARLRAHAPQGK